MTKKKLNILVVEDTPRHIKRARRDLSAHDLRIAETYQEAEKALESHTRGWMSAYNPLYTGCGEFDPDFFEKEYDGRIDVVLTDLYIPYLHGESYKESRGEWKAGASKELHPFGLSVLLQSLGGKIPYIALTTDQNHHQGPLQASISSLSGESGFQDGRHIGESRVLKASRFVNKIDGSQDREKDFDGMLRYLLDDTQWETLASYNL